MRLQYPEGALEIPRTLPANPQSGETLEDSWEHAVFNAGQPQMSIVDSLNLPLVFGTPDFQGPGTVRLMANQTEIKFSMSAPEGFAYRNTRTDAMVLPGRKAPTPMPTTARGDACDELQAAESPLTLVLEPLLLMMGAGIPSVSLRGPRDAASANDWLGTQARAW